MNSRSLNAVHMQQIDDICNAFEAAYAAGEAPRIEEYMAKADPAIHTKLLPELVQLEIHYQPESSSEKLASRFPQLKPDWLKDLSKEGIDSEYPLIPGYFITDELGRGGMGVVYLATDLRLLRQVALKMIHPSGQLQSEHRRRLMGEARAAARLHHPNLVQVFDAGEHEGRPYLVFELVEGGTLAEQIRKRTYSFDESARLMEQVCRAAHFAHQRQIVHRDLKPSNILIGSDDLPRISDFGLAKRLDEDTQQTLSGVLVGTPSYMAPEQAVGKADASSAAVDVYALGAILYELLTGQPPFKAASVMETLELLRTKEPDRPRAINSKVPRDLETICLKCLQKEPGRRYISARVLADDLTKFLNGDSIVARPASAIERTGRWCKRHPLPAALVMALATVLVTGFVAVWLQWRETDRQREIAQQNALNYQIERDAARQARADAEAKSQEAERERKNAERHLAASESRFRKAQAPIQELIRLGSELVRQPNMSARGRTALERATRFLKDLLAEKRDDPTAMYETASAVSSFAWMLLEHGSFVDGEAAIRDAGKIASDLLKIDSSNIRYRRLHRDIIWRQGIAYLRLGQNDKAEATLNDSVQISEVVLNLPKTNSSDHVALGAAYINFAVILTSNRKRDEAAAARDRGIEVLRRCQSAYPRDSAVKDNLSLALSNYASELWAQDQKAAEALAIEALELRRDLVNNVSFARDSSPYFINSLLMLSNWYRDTKRVEEGEKLLAEAMEHSREARQKFSQVFAIRTAFIDAIRTSLRYNLMHKDVDQAERDLQDIFEELKAAVRDFPDEESFKHSHAWMIHQQGNVLALRGDLAEAMKSYMKSLRDLRAMQLASINPIRYNNDILHVALLIQRTGSRFEFEFEKQESVRVRHEVFPDDSVILNEYAWRLTAVKDKQFRDIANSELFVSQSISLHSDRAFYHNTLAICLFHQDRIAEAEEEFKRSIELGTSAPATDWYFLARIRHRQGKANEARELFAKAEQTRTAKHPQDLELQFFATETQSEIAQSLVDASKI